MSSNEMTTHIEWTDLPPDVEVKLVRICVAWFGPLYEYVAELPSGDVVVYWDPLHKKRAQEYLDARIGMDKIKSFKKKDMQKLRGQP